MEALLLLIKCDKQLIAEIEMKLNATNSRETVLYMDNESDY